MNTKSLHYSKEHLKFYQKIFWLLLLFMGLSADLMAQATVMTNKPDYFPGENTVFTGTGWYPGETVELVIQHNFDYHPDEVIYAIADNSGNFYTIEYVIGGDEWMEFFSLKARGITSTLTAETSFTDGGQPVDLPITITGLSSYGPFCPGSSFEIDFTTVTTPANTNTFGPGNIFYAQLSNGGGNWGTGNIRGLGSLELSGTNVSGTIYATIPPTTGVGSGYKIRIQSSDPLANGIEYEFALVIYDAPTPYEVTGGGSLCPGSGGSINIGLKNSQSTVSYQLYRGGYLGIPVGSPIIGTGGTFNFPAQTEIGTYAVIGTTLDDHHCTNQMLNTVEITSPIMPGTLTPNLPAGDVCVGSSVSATATSGTGGKAPVVDHLEINIDGGGWVNYTSGTSVSTTGHTSISIRTYRTGSDAGGGCPMSPINQVDWNVIPLPNAPTEGSNIYTYDGTEKTATAIVGTGEEVVWYTLATGGSVTTAPTGTNYGTYSAYAEARNISAGCLSTSRTLITLTINKADPGISLTWNNSTYNCSQNTATGFAYGVGGLTDVLSPPVTFLYSGTGGTIYGPTDVAPTDAGSYHVVASYAGNENYNSAQTAGDITIAKATPTVLAIHAGGTYNCNAQPASSTVTGVCTDAITSPAVTYSYSGTVNGGATYGPTATAPINAGTYTVVASFSGNDNYLSASDDQAFIISKADPNIVIAGWSGTYDCSSHGASINTAAGVCPDEDLSAGINLGATYTNVPGGTANWTFTDFTGNYNDESGNVPIVINPITVCDANYNGDFFKNTNSTSGGTATILLSIAIPEAGTCDLLNAIVVFNVTVDPGVTKSSGTLNYTSSGGFVTFSQPWTIGLGTNGTILSTNVDVSWTITGNYSNASCDLGSQSTIVTVSSLANDFASGGGYIILASSQGSKAGSPGTKNNFGFNVKWGKNYSRLTGSFNTIWRQDGGISYQARSNKPSSMTVKEVVGTNPKKYQADVVYTNVNMRQLCDGCWSDGNGTVILTVQDLSEPGSSGTQTPDVIGFAVKDKNGVLIFSTNINNPSSTPQTTLQNLDGGNIQVKPAKLYAGEVDPPIAVVEDNTQFGLKLYPNPSNGPITFKINVAKANRTKLEIFTSLGERIAVLLDEMVEAGDERTILYTNELAEGVYVYRLTSGPEVRTGKFIRTFK